GSAFAGATAPTTIEHAATADSPKRVKAFIAGSFSVDLKSAARQHDPDCLDHTVERLCGTSRWRGAEGTGRDSTPYSYIG
ncbi:hypothetical protein, partial [Mycolicibacterium hodleri]|uniref:hypothetical protein n=1 Tax=Mycolicibacterium hodleri TaxID=49897 RepID=UPI0021F3BD6E